MSQDGRKLEKIFMAKFGNVLKKYSNVEQSVRVYYRRRTKIAPNYGWYLVIRFKLKTIKPYVMYLGRNVVCSISHLRILTESTVETCILNS